MHEKQKLYQQVSFQSSGFFRKFSARMLSKYLYRHLTSRYFGRKNTLLNSTLSFKKIISSFPRNHFFYSNNIIFCQIDFFLLDWIHNLDLTLGQETVKVWSKIRTRVLNSPFSLPCAVMQGNLHGCPKGRRWRGVLCFQKALPRPARFNFIIKNRTRFTAPFFGTTFCGSTKSCAKES